MTQEQFLEKYENEIIHFHSMYKHRVLFENTKLGIRCSGIADRKGIIESKETVNSFYHEVDDFTFDTK